jgi:hypothetical protein
MVDRQPRSWPRRASDEGSTRWLLTAASAFWTDEARSLSGDGDCARAAMTRSSAASRPAASAPQLASRAARELILALASLACSSSAALACLKPRMRGVSAASTFGEVRASATASLGSDRSATVCARSSGSRSSIIGSGLGGSRGASWAGGGGRGAATGRI